MTTPAVSVVCSTYQRAARLPGFIAALEAQSFDHDKFEVVLVDNGSTDDTWAQLQELAATTPLDLRVVHLDKNQGAGGGRNAGWRAARAPLVAFTDDDCKADPDWLTQGVDAMSHTGAVVVVGRTEPNPTQMVNSGAFTRSPRVSEEGGTTYLPTCNIFYRRADLDAVGGFDPKFETKGGEDTDLGWRVLDHSRGAVAFAADSLVFHDVTAGSFRAALHEAATWMDIPLVAARHPHRSRPLLVHGLFWKKTHELALLAVGSAGLAVALRNPIPLLGGFPWAWYRVHRWPRGVTKFQRVALLPHAFLIDTVETFTTVRGAIKHRSVVI